MRRNFASERGKLMRVTREGAVDGPNARQNGEYVIECAFGGPVFLEDDYRWRWRTDVRFWEGKVEHSLRAW